MTAPRAITQTKALAMARDCVRVDKWGQPCIVGRELRLLMRRRYGWPPERTTEVLGILQAGEFGVRDLADFITDPCIQLDLPL